MKRILIVVIFVAAMMQGCGGVGAVLASAPVSKFVGDWLFGDVLGLKVSEKGDSTDQMLVKQVIDKTYKYVAPHAEEIEGALVGAFTRKNGGEVGFSMTTTDGLEATLKVFEKDTVMVFPLTREASSEAVDSILTTQKKIQRKLEAIKEAVERKEPK